MEKKNEPEVRYAKDIGKYLIKSCTLSIGPYTHTVAHCEKCHERFEYEDKEIYKYFREFSGKQGNMNLCPDCDEPENKLVKLKDMIGRK